MLDDNGNLDPEAIQEEILMASILARVIKTVDPTVDEEEAASILLGYFLNDGGLSYETASEAGVLIRASRIPPAGEQH